MTDLEILQRARAALVEHGWRQGTFGTTERGFCALGAVRFAAYDIDGTYLLTDETRAFEVRKLLECVMPVGYGLPGWNDYAARTIDDVLALFDRAIAEARETCEVTPEP